MDGTINVLKPPGMTSSDVVAWMRKILKTRKIGHTGTLDPGVAGVLPLCVGQATRVAEYLTEQGKSYRAEIMFGITTDTQDAFGKVLNKTVPCLTVKDFEHVFPHFLGKIKQVPPMYSAVRYEGKHLYEYARQGLEIERISREVVISGLRMVRWIDGEFPRAVFDIDCSKGTYVRTLCHDMGEWFGCGAHMAFLLRLRSGPLRLENSWTLEEIAGAVAKGNYSFLIPLPHGLELPQVILPSFRVQAFGNGLPTRREQVQGYTGEEETHVQVFANGKFLGIGLWKEGTLFPHKVLI